MDHLVLGLMEHRWIDLTFVDMLSFSVNLAVRLMFLDILSDLMPYFSALFTLVYDNRQVVQFHFIFSISRYRACTLRPHLAMTLYFGTIRVL